MARRQKDLERTIGRAKLTPAEEKVARAFFDLPTAGPRTRKWVEALSARKHDGLLASAEAKIFQFLREKRKGVG